MPRLDWSELELKEEPKSDWKSLEVPEAPRLDWSSLEGPPAFGERIKETLLPIAKDIIYGFKRFGQTTYSGMMDASRSFYSMLDSYATKLSNLTGWEKGGAFRTLAELSKAPKEWEPENIIEHIYKGVGGATVVVPQYMVGVQTLGPFGMAGVGAAYGGAREGLKGATKGALKGAMFQQILMGASALPRFAAIPTVAGIGAGMAALEGGDINDIVTGGAVLGILSAAGRYPSTKQFLAPYKEAHWRVRINAFRTGRNTFVNDLIRRGLAKPQAERFADIYFQFEINKAGGFGKVSTKELKSISRFIKKSPNYKLDPDFLNLFKRPRPKAPPKRPPVPPEKAMIPIKPPIEEIITKPPIAPPTKVIKPPVAPPVPKVITKAPISPKAKPMKLQDTIKTAQRVIGKKSTLPVLSNVLIEDGNLIATDLEISYIVKIDKPDGMYKFIGKNLEKSEFKKEDFPDIVSQLPTIDIGKISSREEFITNLQRALRFVSTDETRYVITGPLLKVEKGKGEMVATDGRRLSTSDIALENFKDGKYIIANPNKVLNALKGISGESLTAKTDKDKNMISFEGDNGLVVVRLIEGEFPDYTKVFPKLNQQYIVNKDNLSSALKILKPYAVEVGRGISPPVKIEQKKEKLILSAGEKPQKTMSIPVQVKDVSYMPTKGSIIMPMRTDVGRDFNINYLTDAVNSVKGDTVFIGLTKEKVAEPFHIYGEDLSKVKPTKVAPPKEVKPTVPREAGDKLEAINRMEDEYRKKYNMSLLSQKELQQLGTASLYRKSPKEQEAIINKLYNKAVEKFKEIKPTPEKIPPKIEEIVAGKKITSIEEIPKYRRDWSVSEYNLSIARTEGIIKTGKAPDVTSYHIPHLERLKAEREFLKSQVKPTIREIKVPTEIKGEKVIKHGYSSDGHFEYAMTEPTRKVKGLGAGIYHKTYIRFPKQPKRDWEWSRWAKLKDTKEWVKELPEEVAPPTPEVKPIPPKEKPVEKPTAEEAGFIHIPTAEEWKIATSRILGVIDIETPYRAIGAPKTGVAVKNYFSKRVAHQEMGINLIKKLNRMGYSKEDFTQLAFLAERPTLFVKLSGAERRKFSPGYQLVRKDFAKYFDLLKKEGGLSVPFPESLIRRLMERNAHLRINLEKGRTNFFGKDYGEDWRTEVERNERVIESLKKGRIKFVHIPTRLWFDSLMQTNPNRTFRILSLLSARKRVAPTIFSLVKAGLIKPEEVDIRDSIGNYHYRVGRDLGLLNIFSNAKAEGLVKPLALAPEEWSSLPSRRFPMFKGYKVHPVFADYLQNFLATVRRGYGINRFLAYTKMMQFYNPLFLPMYDVVQATMLGSIPNIKMPIYMAKAISQSIKKPEAYWEAFEDGLFSQPFLNPFEDFKQILEGLKKRPTHAGAVAKIFSAAEKLLPQKVIRTFYNLVWHTAWNLDRTVRLISYNYLLDRGFPSLEAAQVSAKFHGDYASVPPRTRKFLNKIFFTPTFKIVMGKLYASMLRGATRVFKAGRTERIFARGLLYTLAIILGKHYMMTKWGYEADQFSRRYSKVVETDEGPKELVHTFSNPANLPLKYYHRAKALFDPATTNRIKRVVMASKWEFHPVYRVALDIVTNQKADFDYVYDPFAKGGIPEQAVQIARYATGELVRVSSGLIEERKGEELVKAYKAMQKDLGKFKALIMRPFVFTYLRKVKDVRVAGQLFRLEKELRTFIYRRLDDPEAIERAVKDFRKRIEKIQKGME